MYQKIPIHYSWANDTLVFFKMTPNILFPPLFKYKISIIICHMFFNRLKISIYTKDFFNWKLPCMSKHNKSRFFFQNTWISCCHVSMFMVIVRQLLMYQKILIHYSHVVWSIHFLYDYFFTHDKLMVAYKKLSPNSFLATFQL
jgi:hypothetical protein